MKMIRDDGGVWPGFQTWIWGTEENPVLHIHERIHPNGDEEGRDIEVGAIAVWRELLGYDDPLEALEAIIHVDEHQPNQDGVWEDAYALLQLREQAREDAAAQAAREHCDHAEIVARSEQAAYDAVHQPVGGGECAMDRCRREARRKLGCAEPTAKCGVESRTETPVLPEKPSRMARMFQPAQSRRAMLVEALEGIEPLIADQARRFLHALSGHGKDHITPPAPAPQKLQPTAQDILTKYQEAARE